MFLLIIIFLAVAFFYFDFNQSEPANTELVVETQEAEPAVETQEDNSVVPYDDAAAAFLEDIEDVDFGEKTREKSQVLNTIPVESSDQVRSESDTAAIFAERGFTEVEVNAMFAMDGSVEDEVIDSESLTQHPFYSASYQGNDYSWIVYYCNGEFSASPLTYTFGANADKEILISEHEYVMSYDSETNCFYELIPNEEECRIIEVPEINRETLDRLAEGELSL